MLRRMAAALLVLAGCVSAPPDARAPAPPQDTAMPMEPPAATAPSAAAAPGVSVAAPAPRPEPADDDDIIVPGQVERQVLPPLGDPRNRLERREDIRAWDECVSHAQAIFEQDPMAPALETPEDVCSRSLGMESREAVPASRRR